MTGAVREAVNLAGRAERARVARAFIDGVLGSGHPCGDVAALLVDELSANSIRHSGSSAPGEMVTVAVKTANDVIRAGSLGSRAFDLMLKYAGNAANDIELQDYPSLAAAT